MGWDGRGAELNASWVGLGWGARVCGGCGLQLVASGLEHDEVTKRLVDRARRGQTPVRRPPTMNDPLRKPPSAAAPLRNRSFKDGLVNL